MLQFRQSIITLKESSSNLKSITKGNALEILGNCPYDVKRHGNFLKIEFLFDIRRNSRHLLVLADTSPCPFEIEDDKIIIEFEKRSIPKEICLQWLEEVNQDVPNIFFSEAKAIEKDIYFDCQKVSNCEHNISLIYDLHQLARTKHIKIIPRSPLNYKRLMVYKNNNLIFQGTNCVELIVPFEFNKDKLCYDNKILYLDWYNSKNERLTEVFNVEFVQQNVPEQNIQLPIVDLDTCYKEMITGFKVYTDTEKLSTSFLANGELNDIGFYINLEFKCETPKKLEIDRVLVNNNLVHNRIQIYKISDKLYTIYVSPRIIDSEQKSNVELIFKYDFSSKVVTQRIELTNLIYK